MPDYHLLDECLYTPEDEWLRVDETSAFVGVSDYAQQELGDIVFLELPEVGSRLVKDESYGVIESVKAVTDLFAPVTGKASLHQSNIAQHNDLTKPKADISEMARTYVYDRLLFDTDYSFESYQDALKDKGFKILEAHDLSSHLKESYLRLADRTPKTNVEHREHYEWLTTAYRETARAVDNQEVGWGLFVCGK